MVRHPSVVVHTFKRIFLKPVGQSWLNFMCSINGMGEKLYKVLGQIGSKFWFPWQQKPPLTYNGENNVSTFSRLSFNLILFILAGNEDMHKILDKFEFLSDRITDYGVIRPWAFPLTLNGENGVSIFSRLLWIQTSSNLQEMKTGIKSRTGSNFGRIWPVILELPALQRWNKLCLQLFSVTFDWVFVKLAGNEDRHKSSNKFDFGSDRIIHFGVIFPWAPIFNPRGHMHVLNHEQNCIKSDLKEISSKLTTNGWSNKAFLLTSKFCPLPRSYIHVLNHENNCIKSNVEEISLKLATNGKSDKAFLLTPKFSPLGSLFPCGRATCIKS